MAFAEAAAMEPLIQKVTELKNAINLLISKFESANPEWPDILSSYSMICAQTHCISTVLGNDKFPDTARLSTLPLLLSPDVDSALQSLTEGRISSFSYDLVPDYLRTKPDPQTEKRQAHLRSKVPTTAAGTSIENMQRYTQTVNRLCDVILEKVDNFRNQQISATAFRLDSSKSSNPDDTLLLVAATGTGEGLKVLPSTNVATNMMSSVRPPPSTGTSSAAATMLPGSAGMVPVPHLQMAPPISSSSSSSVVPQAAATAPPPTRPPKALRVNVSSAGGGNINFGNR